MPDTPITIGYSLSLTGPLAANGQTARLAHQIWQDDINARGGLLGRQIELICVDDRTDPNAVPAIYESLLPDRHVDLLLGGYGNNSITPAMQPRRTLSQHWPGHHRPFELPEFGLKEIGGCEAAIRPPAFGYAQQLRFARKVVEAIKPLYSTPQSQISGRKNVRTIERNQ